jgi:hypothetical protein
MGVSCRCVSINRWACRVDVSVSTDGRVVLCRCVIITWVADRPEGTLGACAAWEDKVIERSTVGGRCSSQQTQNKAFGEQHYGAPHMRKEQAHTRTIYGG